MCSNVSGYLVQYITDGFIYFCPIIQKSFHTNKHVLLLQFKRCYFKKKIKNGHPTFVLLGIKRQAPPWSSGQTPCRLLGTFQRKTARSQTPAEAAQTSSSASRQYGSQAWGWGCSLGVCCFRVTRLIISLWFFKENVAVSLASLSPLSAYQKIPQSQMSK